MDLVLYSNDLPLLEHWKKLHKNYTLIDNLSELQNIQDSLIMMNFFSNSEEVLKKLSLNNKIFVLDRTPSLKVAKVVLNCGVKGYGNALMREQFLLLAIKSIDKGKIWLYPELTSKLIAEIPHKNGTTNDIKLNSLTKREKEVALLLKDGKTYSEIMNKLHITLRATKTHATKIYNKLSVKDRLGLALFLK